MTAKITRNVIPYSPSRLLSATLCTISAVRTSSGSSEVARYAAVERWEDDDTDEAELHQISSQALCGCDWRTPLRKARLSKGSA